MQVTPSILTTLMARGNFFHRTYKVDVAVRGHRGHKFAARTGADDGSRMAFRHKRIFRERREKDVLGPRFKRYPAARRTESAAAAWDALNLGLYVIYDRRTGRPVRRDLPGISTASPGPGYC